MSQRRGAVQKKRSRLIGFWMPTSWEEPVSLGIRAEDNDKSKFIRRAIREKLERLGIKVEL